jgi:hypothetical protein
MRLTAIFENWHIGDGNYPPLHRGQLVNLSFEFEPTTLAKVSSETTKEFIQLGNAEYRFCGSVLNIYLNSPKNTPSIAEGLDGDEFGIVGASPTINSAYKAHSCHVKYLRDSSKGLQIQVLPL